MKVTVLGCGSSVGVPAAGGFWGKCDPNNPKNLRTRASILVQHNGYDLLVDSTVDASQQLTKHNQQKIDAMIWTHCHSDHVNGVDDLRVISYTNQQPVETYSNETTLTNMNDMHPYLFKTSFGGVYKQFINPHVMDSENFEVVDIGGMPVQTFMQKHANVDSIGFRINDFAYCVDVLDLSDEALEILKGVDTWIVDAASGWEDSSKTHAHIGKVMEWIDIIKPRMTYLTVLNGSLDYEDTERQLPDHVRLCYDGLVLEF